MRSVLILVVIMSFSLFSQFSLYTKYSEGGKLAPGAAIFGTKPIVNQVNFTYFILVQEKWGEAMVGIAYSPTNWLEIGANCGFEQNPSLFRTGASIWVGNGQVSFLTLLEKGAGKDNYWYKSTISCKPLPATLPALSLGVRAWRFNGVGPLIEYRLQDLKFWLLPAYDFEKNVSNLLAGIDIKL